MDANERERPRLGNTERERVLVKKTPEEVKSSFPDNLQADYRCANFILFHCIECIKARGPRGERLQQTWSTLKSGS